MNQFAKIYLVLSSLLLFTSCARVSPPKSVYVALVHPKNLTANDGDRIVGGVQAVKNEFPWMVTINFSDGSSNYFCGGSIIGALWVLSAAHCCQANPSRYTVTAGVYDLTVTTDTQPRNAARVIPNPNFSSQTMYNDLCLIKVDKEFDFSGVSVKPIGLATPNYQTDGVTLTVAGWGLTSGSAVSQPHIIRKVSINGIPNNNCQLYNVFDPPFVREHVSTSEEAVPVQRRGYILAPSQICAGGNGQSSCYGDSGGPLMCKAPSSTNMLCCGAVSGGASCGGEGIYTRVSSFLSWINQVTGIGSGSL